MEWTEITVSTESEAVEAVANILMENGANGVQIQDALDFTSANIGKFGEVFDPKDIPHLENGANVSAYFPETDYLPEKLPIIEQKIKALSGFGLNIGDYKIELKSVTDEDWATAWKKYYHPVAVSRYLTIIPDWEKYEPVRIHESVIKLDPGMAFGTGTHPTTRLSLQALEIILRGGESMIDVGTGSGVLSLAASKLGAKTISAYDLDEVAVQVAKGNLTLNPDVTNISIGTSDLLSNVSETADIIVANILAEIIVPLIPQVNDHLNPRGYLVLAGIIQDKRKLIIDCLQKNKFVVKEELAAENWVALICQREEDVE